MRVYTYIGKGMTDKKLDEIVRRFSEGRATSEEIAYLEKLEKDAEPKISNGIFKDDAEEIRTRESVFDRINRGISKQPKYIWWKYASAAAIFVGILISGYFVWQNQVSHKSSIILADSVTLEHGDGKMEVFGQDGTKKVVDRTGKVIGVQKGSQISYEGTNPIKELVYNTLTVPNGKRFELKLSDGTHIYLNAGTTLKYPIKFLKGRERKVFLTGEAFFGVSKDASHPFVVNADGLDIRVLGTRFNVSSYPEDTTTDVVLLEGSIDMHKQTESFEENSSTVLMPGFKGTFQRNNGEIKKEAVTTDIYTAWMGGGLVFRNMTFNNILKKLERHYNVTIINNNKDLGNIVFNASYGEIKLDKVLEDLKMTHGIEYTIKETGIIIN